MQNITTALRAFPPFAISHSPRLFLIMLPRCICLVALLRLSFAGAEPLHFPLIRKSAILTVDDYLLAADIIRYKYGYNSGSTTSKRQNSAAIPLVNKVCSESCRSINLPLTLGIVWRVVTWVPSRLERRALNSPNRSLCAPNPSLQ